MRRFPKGTTLKKELKNAMGRLESLGVSYPEGYFLRLSKKYSSKGVAYPRTLMRIGEPNIRKHPNYKDIIKKGGKFLDCGCGTGDDIRELLREGYPREKIIGYDVNWKSINLGLDLYMDREEMRRIFIVSPFFRFKNREFNIIYSGSVLHTMRNKKSILNYLANCRRALKNEGIVFGSTLGTRQKTKNPKRLTVLTKEELTVLLEENGFGAIKIVDTENPHSDRPRLRLWFYALKRVDYNRS